MRMSYGTALMADLERARADLKVFADVVGWPLESWQADALTLKARTTALVAPRQSGKSRSLAVLAAWSAFRRQGQRVLLVSAGEDASRRLLAEVRRIVTGSSLLAGSVVDETAGLVTLSNGSEVRSVPASERQVRGWTVDLLLVDEAALVPDDLLLGAALPTTAARPDARVVLASSALTASGAFFDHVRRGDGRLSRHVRTFRWALSDCWWIARETIEAARESMTEARFRAEYEGVFASGADSMFDASLLRRQSADLDLPALGALRGPAMVLGGVDWGEVHDRTCVVCVARLPVAALNPGLAPDVPLFVAWPLKLFDAGTELALCVNEVVSSPAEWLWLAVERNGLGAAPAQDVLRRIVERNDRRREHLVGEDDWHDAPVSRVERVSMSAPLKSVAYSTIRGLLQSGQLVLARDERFLRELAGLRVELRRDGGAGIEAGGGGGHDDLPDGLALSMVPYRRRVSGEPATILGNVANKRSLCASVPGDPGELTVTGGGLVLPRRPALQSVVGGAVTRPPRAGCDWQGEADAQAVRMNPEVYAAVQAGARALRDARASRRAGWGPDDIDHDESGDSDE